MKILYILQETRLRELDSNIIIANSVVNEVNFDYVVIVNQVILLPLLMSPFLPAGIVHLKSIPLYIKDKLEKMRARGHRLTCLNAESVVTFDTPEEYDGFKTHYECAEMIDTSFCTNRKEVLSLENYFRKTATNVNMVVSGNPRMMMERAQCERYYQKEIESIGAQHGRFIFFASTLGPALESKYDNEAALLELYRAEGFNEENSKLAAHWKLYNRGMVSELIKVFQQKSQDNELKDIKVIIRPHPSDNVELIKNIFAPFSDVEVVYHGHVLPWILAADLVLASTSTVLVESVSVGSSTLSFLPVDETKSIYEYLKSHDSNNFCDQVVSAQDLINKIRSLKNNTGLRFHTPEQEAAAREAVGRGLDTPSIMARTFANIHSNIEINKVKAKEYLTGMYLKVFFPTVLRATSFAYWIYASLRLGKDTVTYLKHKSPPLVDLEYDEFVAQTRRVGLDIDIKNLSGVGVMVERT